MDKLEKKVIAKYEERHLSVRQIADSLNLTSAKVRHILDKFGIKRRSISEAIRNLNVTKFKKGNFCIKKNLSEREERLKIAGIMLYWGEGTKDGNSVAFSNSNPEMVLVFLRFLRKICKISEKRLRVLLHFYGDQDEYELKNYWSRRMMVPLGQFSKSFLHESKARTYKKNSKFGTLSLRYSDKELLKIINSWIKEYSGKL